MRTEHLRQWLIDSTWDNTPDATNWLKVVAIIQEGFHDGTLSKECMWETVVLITKGESRDFRGVGLVEVLWNTFTSLLNYQLTTAIKLHDVLHGFWAGQGRGTSALESKILEQILATINAVLFDIFLDLHKVYDALDWDRFFEILATYRVGTRTILLLWTYWDCLNMVAKASGYFGLIFKGYHGANQGYPLYTTLLNVVVNATICHWVTVMAPTTFGLEVRDLSLGELASYLYANNGLITPTQLEGYRGRSTSLLASLTGSA